MAQPQTKPGTHWRTLGLVTLTIVGLAALMGEWFLALGAVVGAVLMGLYLFKR